MTEQKISELAEQAELWFHSDRMYEAAKKFAELVAAAEREACAELMEKLTCMGDAKECFEVAATYIRARGQL
jgi:DNA-directed RNA polymerase subunit F